MRVHTCAGGMSDPADYHPEFGNRDRIRVRFDQASRLLHWWLNSVPMAPKPSLREGSNELCFCIVNYCGCSVWSLLNHDTNHSASFPSVEHPESSEVQKLGPTSIQNSE